MPLRPRVAVTASLAVACATGLITADAQARTPAAETFAGTSAAAPHQGAPATTAPAEAKRVDGVTTDLGLHPCLTAAQAQELLARAAGTPAERTAKRYAEAYQHAECGTADVPLDYDNPTAATYAVPVLRVPARKPDAKIGSLFLNPGGPGGSAVDLAVMAGRFLSPQLLDRFDLVAVEPRQMGVAEHAACFDTKAEHDVATAKALKEAYPTTTEQWTAFYWMAKDMGAACARRPLMRASSTAELVRDTEVVRRTLKAGPLNFLGFSYGTYVAQVYADMFPDRMRAAVADGVLDAESWAGTRAPSKILEQRIQSAEGAERALAEALRACDAAGHEACPAAKAGGSDRTAAQKWTFVSAELAREPLVVHATWAEIAAGAAPDAGRAPVETTLANVQAQLQGVLYLQRGTAEAVAQIVEQYYTVLKQRADGATPEPQDRVELLRGIAASYEQARTVLGAPEPLAADDVKAWPWRHGAPQKAPYRDGFEQFSDVECSDGRHPVQELDIMRQADEEGRAHPNFGKIWAWGAAQCAPTAWKAQDPGAYRGPFTVQTANPVMFVGDTFDPATNISQARKAAQRRPGALLVSSESWGHAAYGTSACVTGAVDAYLLDPAQGKGATCKGDYVPFQKHLASAGRELPVTPFAGQALLRLMEQIKG